MAHINLQMQLSIDFMEAVEGTEKEVTYPCSVACDTCGGSGAKPGTKKTKCRQCNGRGTENASDGIFQFNIPCRACKGQGGIFCCYFHLVFDFFLPFRNGAFIFISRIYMFMVFCVHFCYCGSFFLMDKETISNPCTSCKGKGHVKGSKTKSVRIPAGVDSGTTIRLQGYFIHSLTIFCKKMLILFCKDKDKQEDQDKGQGTCSFN